MKKILSIIVLGLLIGACDNISNSKTTFKDCYTQSSHSSERDDVFDEHTFEIDKDNKTIVRTMVWNDKVRKAIEKVDKKTIPKVSQENMTIISIGDKYITAINNYNGYEYVFNLNEKTIEYTAEFNSGDKQLKIICK
jgi:hypothetical protein